MNRTFSIQSNDDDGGGGCSSTIMTTTNNNNYHHSNQRKSLSSNYIIIKFLLILWLIIGIILYLLDIFLFHVSSTIKDLINLPSDLIFLLAILNNFSLIISIVYELRSLLIVSIIFDCLLLVAIPALIVEVLPNLLTYSSIMISIILAIYYGVLYMNYRYQPPSLFSVDNNNNSYHHGIMMIGKYNRTNLPYDYLSQMAESSRFNSVNYHPQPPPPPSSSTTLSSTTRHHQQQPSATEYLNIFEPSTPQPRRSCQF